MEYYPNLKEESNIAICSNMNEPREYYTWWSKLGIDKWNHLYVGPKNNTNESIYKTEIDS